jgi:hypothetical protein
MEGVLITGFFFLTVALYDIKNQLKRMADAAEVANELKRKELGLPQRN